MTREDHDLEATARALLDRIDREDDPRESYLALNATIDDLRRKGNPVPASLAAAKRQLEIELVAQSQGR